MTMSVHGIYIDRFAACAMAMLILTCSAPAHAESENAEYCLAVNYDLSLGAELPRTVARLEEGGPVSIVAIGSSSTKGLFAKRANTYPQVMKRELERLWPGISIEVVNSGRNGDTVPGNLKRFERDVFAHRPDLVIWQLGTNDVVWRGNVDRLKDKVSHGIAELKAAGADVILMDLQYAPMVLGSPEHTTMQALISEAAEEEAVGLFSRFTLMRQSVEAGMPLGDLVAWDGLHNSRDGYDCMGRALARAIHVAVGCGEEPAADGCVARLR